MAGALCARLVREAFQAGVATPFLMAEHEAEQRVYARVGFIESGRSCTSRSRAPGSSPVVQQPVSRGRPRSAPGAGGGGGVRRGARPTARRSAAHPRP
ncbi:MAG: hypothetical protein ACRDZ4_03540 [Egibacteraceae bacterium]